ncbi:MAG: hypothetical protein H7Y17_14890 [Chlorobia bacterium]|nr:hypothetical protein [Fimbriimonadaceae bacterium]
MRIVAMLLPIVAAVVFAQIQRPIEWTTYSPLGSNFSVSFPGRQSPIDKAIDGRANDDRLRGASVLKNQSGFVLVYCNLPKDVDPQTFLPDAWEKHIATQKYAQVVSKQFDTWQGKPTFEGRYRLGGKLTAYVRLMVTDRKLIQQLATWPDSETNVDAVSQFLSSLKFK